MFAFVNIKSGQFMRAHNPLDRILNSKVKVKILRFLCRTEAEWTGRQIAQEIKVSPAACHKALHELDNERVVLVRSVGTSHLYHSNKDNVIISELIKPLYKRESTIPDEIYEAIVRNISSVAVRSIISVAVFGSMKKRKERATSDVDLLVLVRNKTDKKKVEKDLEKVNEKVMDKFGNIVSPYVQSVGEFRSKYKKGLPLAKNIAKFHKLLFGKPLGEML